MGFSLKRSLKRLAKDPKKFIKNAGKSLGQAASVASSFAPPIPGLREGLAVGGSVLQGKNIKSHAMAGASAYAMGQLGKLGGAAKGVPKGPQIPGLPSGVTINGFTSAANTAGGSTVGTLDALRSRINMNPTNIFKGGAGAARSGVQTAARPSFASRAMDIGRNFFSGSGGPQQQGAPPANGETPAANKGWLDRLGGFFNKPGAIEAGGNIVGGYLEGQAAGKIADEDRKWERERFGREQQLTEGGAAVGLQRDLAMAPMKDQAMFMLQQRMGVSPGAFRPRDMFNESTSAETPQLGGVDLEELKRRNAQYAAGKGGYSTDIQKLLLQKLGYGGNRNA